MKLPRIMIRIELAGVRRALDLLSQCSFSLDVDLTQHSTSITEKKKRPKDRVSWVTDHLYSPISVQTGQLVHHLLSSHLTGKPGWSFFTPCAACLPGLSILMIFVSCLGEERPGKGSATLGLCELALCVPVDLVYPLVFF